ncbi:MAG: hypothetical protein V7776_13270 [Halopseudomonas aestusnigri]
MRTAEQGQKSVSLETTTIRLKVQSLGAMIGPAEFILPEGKTIDPFFSAPWSDETNHPLYTSLPPLLRKLRGEWPCVPFGRTTPPEGLKSDWKIKAPAENITSEINPHGISSNSEWSLEKKDNKSLICKLEYPKDHPIERLERTIVLSQNQPTLYLSLTIHARESTFLPIGLHPVFTLPTLPAAARISVSENTRAWTYPVEVETDNSWFQANQKDCKLNELVKRNGKTDRLRSLPFEEPSEDLVLLSGTGGEVKLDHLQGGYSATLNWDSETLPSCLLWISCGGREYYPWNGRVKAIGIEPIAAPFDLGIAQSGDLETPLAAAGIPTGIQLDPAKSLTINYSISIQSLPYSSK